MKIKLHDWFITLALFTGINQGTAQNYNLEVITGLGTYGIVTVEPGDHTCSSDCTWSYPSGTTLTLLPSAPAGKTFLGWETCNGSFLTANPVYSLTLNSSQCLQAYFTTSSGSYTLTVYKGVSGLTNGSITGTAGFLCASNVNTASQSYASGTVVTLTNNPASGWTFSYWETNGVIVNNSSPLKVTMNGDLIVQAIFVHSNIPPVVSITTPTNNTSFFVCSKTMVSVTASDVDGSVTNVLLFLNSTLVAQSASSPLKYSITNEALLATNILLAEAFDNQGAGTTSTPATFTVSSPSTNQLRVLGIVPTNAFEFCLCGVTDRVYAVQTSTNLLNHWNAWETVTNSSWGVVPVIDRSISNSPIRFYRAGLATDLSLFSSSLVTNVTAGTTITPSITITNESCSAISINTASFHVGFYFANILFSNVPPLVETSVAGCVANGTVAINPNIGIPQTSPGTYYLWFDINDENEVPECNLNNNGPYYWTLTVQ